MGPIWLKEQTVYLLPHCSVPLLVPRHVELVPLLANHEQVRFLQFCLKHTLYHFFNFRNTHPLLPLQIIYPLYPLDGPVPVVEPIPTSAPSILRQQSFSCIEVDRRGQDTYCLRNLSDLHQLNRRSISRRKDTKPPGICFVFVFWHNYPVRGLPYFGGATYSIPPKV